MSAYYYGYYSGYYYDQAKKVEVPKEAKAEKAAGDMSGYYYGYYSGYSGYYYDEAKKQEVPKEVEAEKAAGDLSGYYYGYYSGYSGYYYDEAKKAGSEREADVLSGYYTWSYSYGNTWVYTSYDYTYGDTHYSYWNSAYNYEAKKVDTTATETTDLASTAVISNDNSNTGMIAGLASIVLATVGYITIKTSKRSAASEALIEDKYVSA